MQGVVADYAPDAVMIVPTGVLRGVHEIKPLFQGLIAEFAKPGATFDLQQQVIEGDVAYIRWVAETADNTYELGTDTFFVQARQDRGADLHVQSDTQSLTSARFATNQRGAWL